MRREYDIFEKTKDGASIWQTSVEGQHQALRKLQELAEHSDNKFFAINMESGELLSLDAPTGDSQPFRKGAAV